MIFCVDARTVDPHFPGVGRYSANLIRALVAGLDASEQLVILRRPGPPWAWLRCGAAEQRVQSVEVPLSPFAVGQQWDVPRRLQRLAVNLYHSPYYLMPFWPGVPAVVTLHDLIPLRYPHWFSFSQRLAYGVATRLAARAARRIITGSAAAAQDITRLLRVAPQRIVVVPYAADPAFAPQPEAAVAAVRRRLDLPPRYVLYVGSNKPHKNLVRLMEAWARLRPAGTALVVAGTWDPRFPEAQQRAATLSVSTSVRFVGPVPEPDLPALYSGALLFVYPSEWEGFGFPVIEAMACGVPVASSTAGSLVEVTADATRHFASDDVEAMASAIDSLLADADLRAELSRRGMARAAHFSWQETARSTLEVYRQALASSVHR